MNGYHYPYDLRSSLPSEFQSMLLNDEPVLAVTQRHHLWVLAWWLNPVNLFLALCIVGIFIFLYKLYTAKYEILILTNRRIIGSVNPGLFTKDKVDLMFKAVDNIQEDETFLGNLFGWVTMRIESRSTSYQLSYITKESVRYFKNLFYEQLKLAN